DERTSTRNIDLVCRKKIHAPHQLQPHLLTKIGSALRSESPEIWQSCGLIAIQKASSRKPSVHVRSGVIYSFTKTKTIDVMLDQDDDQCQAA
ncbi:unnamed protein product, partial [Amoebophrya sp. A120]